MHCCTTKILQIFGHMTAQLGNFDCRTVLWFVTNSSALNNNWIFSSPIYSLVVTEWHFAFSQFLFSLFLFIAVSNFWIHERGQEFTRPCSVNPSIWTIIVLTEATEGLKIWGGQAIIKSFDGSDFASNLAKICGQLPPQPPGYRRPW